MKEHLRKPFLVFMLLLFLQTGCTGNAQPAVMQTPAIDPATNTPLPPTMTASPTTAPPTPTSIPPNVSRNVAGGSVQFQNPVKYQVEYVVTVYNGSFGLDRLLVYQPLPVEWDGQSDVRVEEISPDPTQQGVESSHGNGMIYWEMRNNPAAGDSLPFKTRFSFTGYEIVTQIDPEKVGAYDEDAPLYKRYTQPEPYIESSDDEIVAIANKVAGAETNPYKLARKFYDYIVDTAKYKLLGQGLLGAKYLVTSGYGECGDYSALFIALSRAKGIPARPVVGYWAVSGIEQTHVWAEFYLEEVGWIPVDPTVGQDHNRNYYFGNMDNQRVILNKGYNFQLVPPGPDNYVTSLLQEPLWWYWGSSGDENSVSIERTSWSVKKLRK